MFIYCASWPFTVWDNHGRARSIYFRPVHGYLTMDQVEVKTSNFHDYSNQNFFNDIIRSNNVNSFLKNHEKFNHIMVLSRKCTDSPQNMSGILDPRIPPFRNSEAFLIKFPCFYSGQHYYFNQIRWSSKKKVQFHFGLLSVVWYLKYCLCEQTMDWSEV